jgi:sulfatase maturation enzyme AslB (radical SAM superfamily)
MEITLNIANICNLKCNYCIFVGKWSWAKIKKEYVDGLSKLLNIYLERWEKTSLTFSWWWEPLLFFEDIKFIIETLNIVNEDFLDIYIITNWTIYSKLISLFINKNNIFLVLSLDWNKKSHDINRVLDWNLKWTFDLIEKNKDILYSDVIDINYTIYYNNFNGLVSNIEYFLKNFHNFRRINFNFVFNTNVWTNKILLNLKLEFFIFLDFYIKKNLFLKFETNLGNFAYYWSLESENSCINHLYLNRDWLIYKCGAYEFNFDWKPFSNIFDININNLETQRLGVKKCGLKCKQTDFSMYNKKLETILMYIWKKYSKVDKLIKPNIKKFRY